MQSMCVFYFASRRVYIVARIDVPFVVEKQCITQPTKAVLMSGGQNYFYATFELCDTWEDISDIRAVFCRDNESILMPLIEHEDYVECMIPWEVMSIPGVFEVGIFGDDRLLTNLAYVKVGQGCVTEGEEPQPPTPDWFDHIDKNKANKTDLVGQHTKNGGEIFNNYTENKANAHYTRAEGGITKAGGKAFRIIGMTYTDTTTTFTLSNTNGLRVRDGSISGDICNVMLGGFASECGEIINIDEKARTITIDAKLPDDIIATYKQDMHLYDYEKNVLRPVRDFNDDDVGDVYVGSFSHTGGRYTRTFGLASRADGKYTTAEGSYGDAGGYGTSAGYGAMSRGNRTKAKGHYSVADGEETVAEGHTSRAHGKGSVASAQFSVADGLFTKARSVLQRVFGKYNVEDTKGDYAEIYGGGHLGSDGKEYPKNIRTLDWGGRGWYRGGIKIGGENQYDPRAIDEIGRASL